MRFFTIGLILVLAQPVFGQRNEYQVRQENKNYEAWREKAFFGTSSNPSSRPSNPPPVSRPPAASQADYAREANNRYLQARMKEDDAYNARVAQQNARNAELNRKYDRRKSLIAQAVAGVVPAMRLLALDLANDPDATEKDKQAGAAWMAEAASRGDAEAAKHVEVVAQARERQRREAQVRIKEELLARAKAGDVQAMSAVGIEMYQKSSPEIHRAGLAFLRKAAEADDLTTLKFIYAAKFNADATAEDRELDWLATQRLGRLPNQPAAAYTAGERCLSTSWGREPDRAAAMPFLVKAVQEGNKDVIVRIAEIHDKAIGGPRDPATAIEWYRKGLNHDHPEMGVRKQPTRLAYSRVMLEPASQPREHAQELLQLWDDSLLDRYFPTKALALLAADALAGGVLGVQDPDREILYLSRAMCDDWSRDETADRIRLSARFGEHVLNHAGSGLRIVVKQNKDFVIRPAKKADGIWPYCFGTFNAPGATLDACLAAAYTALSIPDEELKAVDQLNCAYAMFNSTAEKFDDATSWYESGRLLLLGKGVDRNAADANQRLLKAWAKGATKSALQLAIIQQKKMIPGASDEAAEEWIQRGALKDDPDCMRHHGLLLLAAKGDDPAKIAERKKAGIAWLEKSGKTGNCDALDDLADVYENGDGVPADGAKTVELLTRAAAGGSGPAKRKLATRLAEGRGVPKDQKAALKLMFDAAQTDQLAAGNLGVVLWRGDWGEKAVEDGLAWMEVALERGFWAAGRNLAKIYHLGLGVPADESKAHDYLERAGTIGGLPAAKAVAEFYAAGEVITKDDAAAARWRTTAARAQVSASP